MITLQMTGKGTASSESMRGGGARADAGNGLNDVVDGGRAEPVRPAWVLWVHDRKVA